MKYFFRFESQAFLLLENAPRDSCINASNSRKSLIFSINWTIGHTGMDILVILSKRTTKMCRIFCRIFFSVRIGGLFERFTITISQQAATTPGGVGVPTIAPAPLFPLVAVLVDSSLDRAVAWLVWPLVLDPHIYVGNNVGNI